MKIPFSVLLLLFSVAYVWAVDPITIEAFKRISDPAERMRVIKQAPAGQQNELIRINRHLRLVECWGGEAELAKLRKSIVAEDRGVGALLGLVVVQSQIWDHYIGAIVLTNKTSGMTREQQVLALRQLQAEHEVLRTRILMVRELVFHLAPSPQALELNAKAKAMRDKLQEWTLNSAEHAPIKETQREMIDKGC